jgi:preprotein translocase subunit SecF
MALISLPSVFTIPFARYRLLPFILMGVMTALVLLGALTRGLNWGVDFKGGVLIEAQLAGPRNLDELRKECRQTLGREVVLQEVGQAQNTVLIRTELFQDVGAIVDVFKPILGKDTVYRRVESIGPKVGQELIKSGLYAIAFALVGMMIYVWFRFEWQFSVCAFAALIHDCLGLLAFFMLTGLEFNESAIVAILITSSYSINDTVVIFDRLRENMKGRNLPFVELINLSLNETFSRTLLTSSTALLALLMMYLFGGEVISSFSLPILAGIVIGAYSSVVIAVPLLRWLPLPKA